MEDYEVTVNDSTSDHAVTAVDVSGRTVRLTLGPAVVASDIVLVSYTPDESPVQDSEGADAVELRDHPVTNSTQPDPPVYVHLSGVVNGDTLTLMYSEALDPDSEPATTTYTVTADSTTHTVSDVAISGTTVTLTLTTPVQGGQTVRLSYDVPPSTDPLQDLDGEDAAPLTDVPITNNTDVPPSLVSTNDSAVVDGETLTLTYNKALDEASEPAYTVKVDTVPRAVNTVSVSGMTVTLTLASAVVGGEPVTVSYQPPQTSPLQDDDGTPAGTLTDHPVKNITNNSPGRSARPDSRSRRTRRPSGRWWPRIPIPRTALPSSSRLQFPRTTGGCSRSPVPECCPSGRRTARTTRIPAASTTVTSIA